MAVGVAVVREMRREAKDPDGRWEMTELSHCATGDLVVVHVHYVDVA